MTSRTRLSRRTVMAAGAGLAATAGIARFNIVRAQSGPLKVGVILPRSGVQAFIGQSCQKGADIAPQVLKELGYKVDVELMNADTETNVDVARSRAERLINDGAHILVGAFDSGQTLGIAQVSEQKGIPFVVNIAAAPQITDQGYKTVFRVFPTSVDLIRNGLAGFKDVFAASGKTPKAAVLLHINDTFGQANKAAIDKLFPAAGMPFQIVDSISYDPAARDLSVEIAKAKATGADLAMVVTRLNDAILMTREMIKQRWEPMGIMSPGSPGMYEEQYFTTLGKFADGPITVVPWFNPNAEVSKKVDAVFKQKFPNDRLVSHSLNVGYTLEAIMVAADAAQRAGSTKPEALIEALKTTKIDKRMMIGDPISFDEKGQNKSVQSAVVQNRGGAPKVVLPKQAAEADLAFPMPGWAQRG